MTGQVNLTAELDGIELHPSLKPFVEYFKKPVALQLKSPLVGIEATMESTARADGDGVEVKFPLTQGLGWPTLALLRDADGRALDDGSPKHKLLVVLFGMLMPSQCGTRLVFVRSSDLGAKVATLIAPSSVDYITTVVEVPVPEVHRPQHIVAP